jgi:CHAT domain-containing protein/Tfp pilus assembly protein PilF
MRRLFLVLIYCLPWLSGFGQKELFLKIDSAVFDANYPAATQIISDALSKAPDQHTSVLLKNKSAEVLILQGKLTDAENVLQTISTVDPFEQAVTETNLGYLYLNRARNDLALQHLQKALGKFQDSGTSKTPEAARCLSDLSLLYLSTGKLNQAEENGLIALQIRRDLFGEDREEVAASYNDLGLVYAGSNGDKALEYYEKAMAVYEKIHGKDHPKIAVASSNIGTMYRQLGLYGDAVNNFETALAIWKKIYPSGHPNEAFVLVNLGLTYNKMGDRKAALGYFEKALDIYTKAYGQKHPSISFLLNQIGTIQLEQNNFDHALSSFQDAILANTTVFNQKEISKNPPVKEYYNGKVLLYSLRLKAQALESKYYGKSLRLTDLILALSCLQSCDTLIDNIRHLSEDEHDKIELGESANEAYEDGVRIAQSISLVTVHPKRYRLTAFYFAEKSKSAVLQESIAESEAKSFAGIPADLVEKERGLKSTITFLTQKLSQKPTADEEKTLRQFLFNANIEYETLVRNLEKDYPKYYDLKYNQSSPTVSDVQSLLDNKTAVLSFFVAEKGKRVYQFIITKKNFRLRNLTLPSNFDKLATGLTNSVLFSETKTYLESAPALSKVLLPPMPKSIKDLVIIPSGRLGTIPFEVLLSKKSRTTDFKTMPFAIRRFAISYEFSIGLLIQKSKTPSTAGAPAIFLCAPIHFPDNDNLDDLPGTENEVNTIARLFSGHPVSIVKMEDANEDLIKSGTISQYNYLHFATHGIVDESNPELSQIFLQSGKQDDGHLFSGEIYNLNLHADLTVLSACQTGLGKLSKGEGVIGLSRALVYAGARNIIVSFWSVSDESTSQLMTDFYKILLQQKTQNFRETLQQAKVNMITTGKYPAPYYWAPFILIGY